MGRTRREPALTERAGYVRRLARERKAIMHALTELPGGDPELIERWRVDRIQRLSEIVHEIKRELRAMLRALAARDAS